MHSIQDFSSFFPIVWHLHYSKIFVTYSWHLHFYSVKSITSFNVLRNSISTACIMLKLGLCIFRIHLRTAVQVQSLLRKTSHQILVCLLVLTVVPFIRWNLLNFLSRLSPYLSVVYFPGYLKCDAFWRLYSSLTILVPVACFPLNDIVFAFPSETLKW